MWRPKKEIKRSQKIVQKVPQVYQKYYFVSRIMLRGRVLNSPKWQRISKDIYFIFFFGLTVFFTATKSLKGNHEARDDGPDRIVSEIKTQFSNHSERPDSSSSLRDVDKVESPDQTKQNPTQGQPDAHHHRQSSCCRCRNSPAPTDETFPCFGSIEHLTPTFLLLIVEIRCMGEAVIPTFELHSLVELWLETTSKHERVAAKEFVMVLVYARKLPECNN
ncbi:hypothetical protein YC2023_027954 [Brassica napus]